MSDWDEWRKGEQAPAKPKPTRRPRRRKFTDEERQERMRVAGAAQSRAKTDLSLRYPDEYRELYLMHKADVEAERGMG